MGSSNKYLESCSFFLIIILLSEECRGRMVVDGVPPAAGLARRDLARASLQWGKRSWTISAGGSSTHGSEIFQHEGIWLFLKSDEVKDTTSPWVAWSFFVSLSASEKGVLGARAESDTGCAVPLCAQTWIYTPCQKPDAAAELAWTPCSSCTRFFLRSVGLEAVQGLYICKHLHLRAAAPVTTGAFCQSVPVHGAGQQPSPLRVTLNLFPRIWELVMCGTEGRRSFHHVGFPAFFWSSFFSFCFLPGLYCHPSSQKNMFMFSTNCCYNYNSAWPHRDPLETRCRMF